MDPSTWHDAGPLGDVVQPWPERELGDVVVRLVRVAEDRVVAIAPACPHMDAPLTSAEIHDGHVECPRHWYAFDLETGACLSPPRDDVSLGVWPTRIVAGRIEVQA